MTYLITGISGFVGGHYIEYLLAKNIGIRICGIDNRKPKFDFLKDAYRKRIKFYHGSLLNKNRLRRLIEKTRPDYIVNLAAQSSVAYSWKNPVECYMNNTGIFLNVVEAAKRAKSGARILSVGSSEEYGITGKGSAPVTESSPLRPLNPYAVSRIAQEYFAKIYAKTRRVRVISTRSFNHIGPRQSDAFVISSLAKQVIEAKKGLCRKIVCGNLDIVRDFTDVRDVVRAYDLLLRKGRAGEAYNVCSGKGHKLSEILRILRKKAGVSRIAVERDPKLARPADNKAIVGSSRKLRTATGFKPNYTLSRSLTDILSYWENLST